MKCVTPDWRDAVRILDPIASANHYHLQGSCCFIASGSRIPPSVREVHAVALMLHWAPPANAQQPESHMKLTTLPLLAALAAVFALPAAEAQNRKQVTDSYKQMCVQAADMPAPFGEYDLKGNARLGDYCGCFGEAFAEHAMKVDPKAKPPTADEATRRDLAMRNTCRKKIGLPLAK